MKTPETEALRIFALLTPEQIAYAKAHKRQGHSSFSALHDLMDANDLLPEPPLYPCDSNGSVEDEQLLIDDMNNNSDIMDHVSALIDAA